MQKPPLTWHKDQLTTHPGSLETGREPSPLFKWHHFEADITLCAVQPIYYPGFTIVGLAEPVAIISTIALLVLTRRGGADSWLTLVALLGLIGMHAVYWLITHPVNNFWLQGEQLSDLGSGFFSWASTSGRGGETPAVDWTDLRDRWEYSHVARAGLAALSFISLLIVVSSAGGT